MDVLTFLDTFFLTFFLAFLLAGGFLLALGLLRGSGLGNDESVVATVHGRVDALCNDVPGWAFLESGADLCIGDTQVAKAEADAFEGAVKRGDIDVVSLRAAVDNDSMDNHEGVTVGTGLCRSETDFAKVSGAADHRLYDNVAFSAASIVVEVAMNDCHGLHG